MPFTPPRALCTELQPTPAPLFATLERSAPNSGGGGGGAGTGKGGGSRSQKKSKRASRQGPDSAVQASLRQDGALPSDGSPDGTLSGRGLTETRISTVSPPDAVVTTTSAEPPGIVAASAAFRPGATPKIAPIKKRKYLAATAGTAVAKAATP